jgi:hypothetical protein
MGAGYSVLPKPAPEQLKTHTHLLDTSLVKCIGVAVCGHVCARFGVILDKTAKYLAQRLTQGKQWLINHFFTGLQEIPA